MRKITVLNIKRGNWASCVKAKIFGVKVGTPTPSMNVGDILLARLLKNGTKEYGVKGLWHFKEYEAVTPQTFVAWTDGAYSTILHFEPLVLEFRGLFSEDFRGWESTKVKGLAQVRLNASVVSLKSTEARDYLQGILSEMESEININVNYLGRNVNLKSLLREILDEIESNLATAQSTVAPVSRISGTPQPPGIRKTEILGPRIDSPILNYAPLNELGVVLLFGYYMHELGFSHMEQMSAQFPDAIGLQHLPDGRLQRVRIEFEYKSRSFERHNHDPNQCDVIVCWIHDWRNYPPNLQVIELKSFIETLLRG